LLGIFFGCALSSAYEDDVRGSFSVSVCGQQLYIGKVEDWVLPNFKGTMGFKTAGVLAVGFFTSTSSFQEVLSSYAKKRGIKKRDRGSSTAATQAGVSDTTYGEAPNETGPYLLGVILFSPKLLPSLGSSVVLK